MEFKVVGQKNREVSTSDIVVAFLVPTDDMKNVKAVWRLRGNVVVEIVLDTEDLQSEQCFQGEGKLHCFSASTKERPDIGFTEVHLSGPSGKGGGSYYFLFDKSTRTWWPFYEARYKGF